MKKGTPINEQDLDRMLNSMFLDKNANAPHPDLADFIMNQDYPVKTNPAREEHVLQRLNKNTSGTTWFSVYLNCLAFVLISFTLTFSFFDTTKTETNIKKDTPFLFSSSVLTDSLYPTPNNKPELTKKTTGLLADKVVLPLILPELVKTNNDSLKTLQQVQVVSESAKDGEAIPQISEADKLRFKKIKNMMLERLYRLDKKIYTHIEAEKVTYKDSDIVVDAYSMRNFSVTNLEYKTFLADLISMNRKEDYLKAAVLSGNWNIYQCNLLYSSYFTDEKYNDFPVVNISLAGAQLFCKWLEEELLVYAKQNSLKVKPLKLRLPMDIEWIYAAWSGYTKVPYESGYNTIFDVQEGLVDEYFSKRLNSIGKKVKRSDTLYDLLNVNMFGWNEKKICDMLNSGLSRFNTNPADTIYPERMKVFTKTNHVSEIVFQRRSERIWLIGAAWKNKDEYNQMAGDFVKHKSSPFVGFRFVVINEKDSEYKNPFW